MKNRIVLTIMMACAFAPSVYAAGPGGGPDNRQNQQKWYQSGPGHDERRGAQQQHNNRQNGNRPGNNERYGKPGNTRDYFSWQGRDYRRGQPAPERFRGERYRVNDWRARGLSQPPSGHYWSRIDGNYVLIAAATGVIATILLGNVLSH